MPGIPPDGICGELSFSSGSSATKASVVNILIVTLAAFSTAFLVTFAGSIMPSFARSVILPVKTLSP